MASLHVRNLEDEIITRLKRRAARNGRSAEAEHREILRSILGAEAEARDRNWEDRAAKLRKAIKNRLQTPSEDLLRESRDQR